MKSQEGYFKGDGGIRLFFQFWESPSPKGLVCITHGQGEHTESYHRLRDQLLQDRWSVIAWDLRGHGRSAGGRGDAPSFDHYVRDYQCFLEQVVEPLEAYAKLQKIYLAHSLGGLIHLKLFINQPELAAQKQVLSSPLLGLDLPFVSLDGAWMRRALEWIPRLQMNEGLAAELCSRDPEIQNEYRKDILRHTRLSTRVITQAIDAAKRVQERAPLVIGALLLLAPERDPIVDTKASLRFFKNIGSKNKVLKVYPQRRHELFNDLGREEVFKDLLDFLNQSKT